VTADASDHEAATPDDADVEPGIASSGPGSTPADTVADTVADTDTVIDTSGGTDADADADQLAEEIDSELLELAAERDTFRDLAQRIQADFENYRRRMQTQIRDEADRATGKLAEALLPMLDATEAAYLRHPDEVGPLLNLLLGELRKQGLESLDLEGQPFDPNLADAVAHEAGEGGEIVVAEVLRSGYRWKDRTLRPAMVRTVDRAEAPVDAPADADAASS